MIRYHLIKGSIFEWVNKFIITLTVCDFLKWNIFNSRVTYWADLESFNKNK